MNKKRVLVAMSGGVDSSVAAALLKERGFDVVGVFMKFWSEPPSGSFPLIYADSNADSRGYNRCCSPESETRARLVANKLGIPFYVFNFEKEFKKKVVDYFLKEYKSGRTPNPCVVCNKEIKFGLLFKKLGQMDADYIATGHYARIKTQNSKLSPAQILSRPPQIFGEKFRRASKTCGGQETQNHNLKLKTFKLLKAKDKQKDQSYFLWGLNQKILRRTLFPIGDYKKEEVRELAKKFELPVLNIPESMEICFIQDAVADFLKQYLLTNPGKILNTRGETIGEHQGLWFYTIGQRKGLDFSDEKPNYVLTKDLKKNILVVTKNKRDLFKKELIAKNVNWISRKPLKIPLEIKAKIRYGHKSVPAAISRCLKPKVYTLRFRVGQRAITPGQSVVFYQGQEILGGGIIK